MSSKRPDISVESWARFLSLWKSEEWNYPTDTGKLAVLSQRSSDKTDKLATESMSNLSDFMA